MGHGRALWEHASPPIVLGGAVSAASLPAPEAGREVTPGTRTLPGTDRTRPSPAAIGPPHSGGRDRAGQPGSGGTRRRMADVWLVIPPAAGAVESDRQPLHISRLP